VAIAGLPVVGAAMKLTCIYCNSPIPDPSKAWRQATGWIKPRQAGGPNSITARKDLDNYACDDCVRKVQRGEDPTAKSLF
jgi:hypothetical protein